ncbi:MAG: ABC transporter substrate-binding protein [Actinomycetota bacterium]|nr:MAG: ABC transporter substrate-binding protein [Actinomycetota bacterium]
MKRIVLGVVAAVATVGLAACGSSDPLASGSSASVSSGGPITVGSANFPENVLLAEIYAQALQGQGIQVSKKLNIGSRETYLPALQDGSINLIPEYTGVLLQYFDKSATASSPDDVYAALQKALPTTLTVLAKSPAQDKDSLVVTKQTATQDKLTTIADLGPYASQLVLGGPPEFKTRPTGVPGLTSVYGLTFKEFKPLDTAGPLTVQALKNGQVQVANLFSTDAAIVANDFVVLDDPKNLFGSQNVVPLLAKAKADPTVTATLNKVSAALDTTQLTALVGRVQLDKADPATVAKDWLTSKNLA